MPDGPRALKPDEWTQLDALVSAVFRPQMFHDYPQLFNERNRHNLRVVAEDGKVVTHVGMIERPASLAGCRIDVACIGAVSTYPDYRGRGFASQAFQDCCEKAAADGIDLMMISGGRGLYTRVGCRQVGQDWDVAIAPEGAAALGSAFGRDRYRLLPLGPERIDDARRLYEAEPVRFLRAYDDWQMAWSCGVVMNTASDFWGVAPADCPDEPAAYLIVHQPHKVRRRHPDDPLVARIVEFAGDRAALLAATPLLLEHYGAGRVALHVQGHDVALRALLIDPPSRQPRRPGITATPAGTSGTLRVINFVQLMERCRPLLAERIGWTAYDLRFAGDERPGSALGGFTISLGSELLRIPDLATLDQWLFGSPRPREAEPAGSAQVARLLERALPLPSLWYGISYV